MKSSRISIYALLLAGIGLFSCNNDDLEKAGGTLTGETGELVDMTFSASMGGKSLAKSTASATTGETKFSNTDHIKIFTLNGASADFSCAGVSDNGSEAQFAGSIARSNGYYGVLPYQENASVSGNTMTVNLNPEQTSKYEELMVGYTTNSDAAFQFKHVGAMIRFVTQKKFSAIEIEDMKGNKIAGDITVKVSSDGKITEVSGGTSSKVSLTRDITSADSVLITLKPGTYAANELRIKFTDKSRNSHFYHEIDKAMTFKSGVIYKYGNVGQYLITCKEKGTNKTLFTLYAADYENSNNDVRGRAILPTMQAEEGYVYGYHTNSTATTPKYGTEITNIQTAITLYPVKIKGMTLTIYDKGANSTPTKMVVFPNANVTLPKIALQPKQGCVYGYATTANGNPQYESGATIPVGGDMTLYAVEIEEYSASIYGNGESQAPTKTFKGIAGFSFTLPALPEKNGQFAGYSTKPNDTDIKYYQNQSLIYDTYVFDQTTSFYPVYRDVVSVTKTNNVSMAGKSVGEDYSKQLYMGSPMPKVEKGTCSVFKFINHCNPSAPNNNNVSIVLLDQDNLSTTNAKIFRIDQRSYGEPEFRLNSTDFMANINNTEVTVKVYNKGGIADMEISWKGTNDNKDNYVKFSNISIWSDLYVTFGVNKSYIEFK